MKKYFRISIIMGLILSLSVRLNAQETKLSQEYKEQAIQTLCKLMNERYVFPDVAKKTETHLNKQLKAGHFTPFETVASFADALTESVQFINKDKHMRIRPNPPYEAPENTPERLVEERLNQINHRRSYAGGFYEVKKLEGNVGYLDLRGFAPLYVGGPVADSYMQLLAGSDAIIIDLRKNGGGSPEMVQYLCSYFFDQKVHLNSLYWREGDVTREFWTLDKVAGKRLPDVPLFVMTSDRTFSAAEEFSYNMQTQKRATLVGQTTGGGANPGGTVPINSDLGVFIPTGRAINPITKTNWEGVGVIPEVPTEPEEAMDKAHELAKSAATEYKAQVDKKHKTLLSDLQTAIDSYTSNSSDKLVVNSFKACLKAGLIEEAEINYLGYEYMNRHKKPETAEVIFKANTLLHSESANTYDSYAEALMENGNLQGALTNYQKAVDLAKANDDENLETFKENLERVKKKLAVNK